MVIDVGAAVAGEYNAVLADILAVRDAVGPEPVLKVIVESAALSDDAIVETCRAAEQAGANFVKTSTGFHPRRRRACTRCGSWPPPSAGGSASRRAAASGPRTPRSR